MSYRGPAMASDAVRARWNDALEEAAQAGLERVSASDAELAAYQTDNLRAVVATAKERSPWHAARLRAVDDDSLTSRDLSPIPRMTKADMMANWDRVVTDPQLTLTIASAHLESLERTGQFDFCLGRFVVVATGGSTGLRGVFAFDVNSFAGSNAQNLTRVRASRSLPGVPSPPGRVVQGRVTARAPTHLSTALGAIVAGNAMDVVELPAGLPIAEIVAGLNRAQPNALMVYPSALHRLAVEAQAGRLRIEPVMIGAVGEPLLPETMALVEDAFGVGARNLYGASEAYIAQAARPGDRHLNTCDNAFLELGDEHNRPVRPGERSAKILLTNLHNHLQPLLRYELTDEVAEYTGHPPVPWSGRWIEPPLGRMDDWFTYGEASVHPHLFRSRLANEPAIVQYQVIQTQRGASIFVVIDGPLDPQALAGRLESDLAAHVHAPELRIEVVDAIERHAASGKLKRFVPMA
jgi:phenylacetate-CoA ligase